MNKWIKRCAVVAFAVGLMVAGPVPAFAGEDVMPSVDTSALDTSALADLSDLGGLTGLDARLAAIRTVIEAIVGADGELDGELPGGPPIPIPVPNTALN